jgi:hypothetical protein
VRQSGFRTVQGGLITRIQQVLRDKGFYRDTIDGIYGNKTEQALLNFQQQNNLQVTGKIDDKTWKSLTSSDVPNLNERCLQVTADFEGTGFSKIVGNFDSAGLTWGIIGFTLRHGELQKLLNEIRATNESIFNAAFGELIDEIDQVLNSSSEEQIKFANRISIGSSKIKVLDEWAEAFATLGNEPAVQVIQLQHTSKFFDIAMRDVGRFNLENELGLALCFDIAVQNGGIDQNEAARIRNKIEQNLPATQQDLRIIIANVVAENSNPRFIEDVRSRKMTFATGISTVHGSNYNIKTWGFDELPAE